MFGLWSLFFSAWDRQLGFVLETFTTIRANSEDDKSMLFFSFPPKNSVWHFMQIVFTKDNLHEISNPIFYETEKKYFKMSSVEKFNPAC